ncbi:chromate efflux transporter [Luteimonas sp. SX5]|uniref:Chromate efflux transporter n=1 Tax=Luteimonas galliterrae TaxID=2940486 RepID=A0ABT0MI86_9GAMM|nr:chromate efflux transporter [Luteimonas galliterrae]MCL1634575.1 chromate efflux transporter [Luteimonas galliterrae]
MIENRAGAVDRAYDNAWTIFLVFLRLGLTSFGGPIAHLGYFREEFVVRRRWLSEQGYSDLIALCQFLPGPASSQVGMAVGLARGGLRGALAAWCGFTLPSALAMVLFALAASAWGMQWPSGAVHGLLLVAVAVVAQAVWGMARTLCPDAPRIAIALASAVVVLLRPDAWGQIGVIAAGGIVGAIFFRRTPSPSQDALPMRIPRRLGALSLLAFFALLLALPLATRLWPVPELTIFSAFYRAGSLVFGGGHVVLPLLQAAVVPTGWISDDAFLAGYGAAQAVPGPLFTFAAYLGAAMSAGPGGWWGGLLCLTGIFLPSFLLVIGVLPFWSALRRNARMQAALAGVNAAVVGLLLAALYRPVWTSAVHALSDAALVVLGVAALTRWKLPPWLVVLGLALTSLILGLLR